MTSVTPIGADVLPAQIQNPNLGLSTSQNLFEHAAQSSNAASQGITPAELGADIMSNLDGFIERVQHFSDRTIGLDSPSQTTTGGVETTQAVFNEASTDAAGGLNDSHFDRIIESLSNVFDHAIETQMVVRGATQISGSANTLLRGQ